MITLADLTPADLKALVREAVRAELAVAPAEILTREQVAALLNVSTHYIPKLIKRGLPAHRFHRDGRQWRFRRSEVEEWMSRHEEGT